MITPIEFRTPPRKGKVAGVALWALVAAVLWASSSVPCQAALTLAQVEFSAVPGEGVLYPLRKGQSDQNDLYPAPYVKWETGNPPTMEGAPGCFLRNTRLRSSVTVNWAPPPPLMNPRGVELTLILKKFAENGELTDIWQWTSAITPVQPNTSVTLDCPSNRKLPDYIERMWLSVRVVLYHQVGGQWQYEDGKDMHTHLGGVLSEPLLPMNPAWWTVLWHSCVWASGTSGADPAAEALTTKLYDRGTYDPDQTFISNASNNGETFHLKNFLEHQDFPRGQCNDFADFLVCLITSVGAQEQLAQRSNPVFNSDGTPNDWTLYTKEVDPAGGLEGPGAQEWWYHQFSVYDANVWDGCIKFEETGDLAIKWDREPTYRDALVDHYEPDPPAEWKPTPSPPDFSTDGFVPDLTTQ